MSNDFAKDYVDVAERISIFRDRYPEGSLRAFDPSEPVKVITVTDQTFLQYVACAYRHPEDPIPGIGVAWEPFPGWTPYTRNSEAMVAETSAWGRAIVAALAADTKRGIASAEEVRNRQAPPPDPAQRINDAKRRITAAVGGDVEEARRWGGGCQTPEDFERLASELEAGAK